MLDDNDEMHEAQTWYLNATIFVVVCAKMGDDPVPLRACACGSRSPRYAPFCCITRVPSQYQCVNPTSRKWHLSFFGIPRQKCATYSTDRPVCQLGSNEKQLYCSSREIMGARIGTAISLPRSGGLSPDFPPDLLSQLCLVAKTHDHPGG